MENELSVECIELPIEVLKAPVLSPEFAAEVWQKLGESSLTELELFIKGVDRDVIGMSQEALDGTIIYNKAVKQVAMAVGLTLPKGYRAEYVRYKLHKNNLNLDEIAKKMKLSREFLERKLEVLSQMPEPFIDKLEPAMKSKH